jgi:hypothetical protein
MTAISTVNLRDVVDLSTRSKYRVDHLLGVKSTLPRNSGTSCLEWSKSLVDLGRARLT